MTRAADPTTPPPPPTGTAARAAARRMPPGRRRWRPWRVLGVAAGALLAALLAAAALLHTPDKPRAALEAIHAATPDTRFLVLPDGLRLHLRDSGPRDAPAAVLLLHGFGSSLHTWEDWAVGLSDAVRVVRLDLPGFGLTGPDPTGDYSDERAVAVLDATLDALGIARASVVGSSMGGRIAWRFAAARPDRVERLVLMAPDGFAGPGRSYDTPPRVPLLLRALPYVLPERLLRATLAGAYADPADLTPERFARYRDMLLAPGVRRAVVARTGQAVLPRPEPILRTIRAPVLLVWGEADRLVPVSHAEDYLRALPPETGARLVAFPGVGHVPMEEDPARTLEPVRAFLLGR